MRNGGPHRWTRRVRSVLDLDAEKLSACVSCGLCLPHCPTFRVTGEEAYSPRGRIDAMRGVQNDGAPIDAEFVDFMETCVQCRGCEPACPSNVEFGALMEQTRTVARRRRGGSRRGGSDSGSGCSDIIDSCSPGPRCWRLRSGSSWCRHDSVCPSCRCAGRRRSPRLATTSGCSPAVSWTRGSARPTRPRPN